MNDLFDDIGDVRLSVPKQDIGFDYISTAYELDMSLSGRLIRYTQEPSAPYP